MPGIYGKGVYGGASFGIIPPLSTWPPEEPHGVGPPRPGLHPRSRLFPGHDPDLDVVPPRRTIQYPGTTADRRPGRGLFIFDSSAKSRSAVSLMSAAGRLLVTTGVRGYRRITTLAGSGRLSDVPLASSDLPTTLSQVVTLGTVSERVELASSGGTVEIASGAMVVELR